MPAEVEHRRDAPDDGTALSPAGDVSAAAAVAMMDDDAGFVDRRVDLAICVVALVLGLFLVFASGNIRRGSIPDPIGSGGWARVLGIALSVIAAALVFRRLAEWRGATTNLVPSDGGKDGEAGYPSSGLRPYLFVAAGFGWLLGLPRLGFLVPTFALTVAGVAAMQVRGSTKLFFVPLIFTVILWFTFGQVFGIHFPAGPIETALQQFIPRFH